MRLGLFLVFAAIPFLELALLIKLGQWIGFWLTLGLIGLTAMIGAYVINRQSLVVMQQAMESVSRGSAPIASAVEGVFVLMAGFLLITPGLITDVMGLMLLVPPIRRWFAVMLLRRILKSPAFRFVIFGQKMDAGGPGHRQKPSGEGPPPPPPRGDFDGMNDPGTVIEGEFERLDETTVDPNRRRPKT